MQYQGYSPSGYNINYQNSQALQRLQALQPYDAQFKSCIKALPVTSVDEAKVAMIDLDGSLFIFVNLAKGEIYTKQYNLQTGYSDFQTYKLCKENGCDYVTMSSFKMLEDKVDLIVKELGGEVNELNAIDASSKASTK